jgi:hypothetical protein
MVGSNPGFVKTQRKRKDSKSKGQRRKTTLRDKRTKKEKYGE